VSCEQASQTEKVHAAARERVVVSQPSLVGQPIGALIYEALIILFTFVEWHAINTALWASKTTNSLPIAENSILGKPIANNAYECKTRCFWMVDFLLSIDGVWEARYFFC
jgi:hypothetical protein